MNRWIHGLIALAAIASGQPAAPSFTADRVLPWDSARSIPLAPGLMFSIYGQGLGPEQGCEQHVGFYPAELCGVQVFIGEKSAGLSYVQAKQINFVVPQDVPLEGEAQVRVVFQNRSSAAVNMRLGRELPKLSVEGVARVGAPLWIDVDMPYGWGAVVYPVSSFPNDFGCNQLEVRQNGVALAPLAYTMLTGRMGPGNGCGNDTSIAGHPVPHQGRLPLHLLYRLEKPGVYEVRYTRVRTIFGPEVRFRSEWTRIEVLAAQPVRARARPQDPEEILRDVLPNLLGFPDAASLAAVLEYAYHPNENVRRYAAMGLGYWPRKEIEARVAEVMRTKGPSDVLVNLGIPLAPDLIDAMLPYLKSDNPVVLRGAIVGIARLVREGTALPSGAADRAETALGGAVEHIVRMGGQQTISDFAQALGALHGEASRTVLWNLAEQGVAREQSRIAITWRKDARDLPRLAALLTAPGDPQDRGLASIPYALRNGYGDAALPYLESALKDSGNVWVPINCARELILAGRKAGFAFVVDAMEQNRAYRREIVEFVRERFPELKGADDGVVLALVKRRVK
jgi:hypothetical protein